jgi:hypothetical protein
LGVKPAMMVPLAAAIAACTATPLASDAPSPPAASPSAPFTKSSVAPTESPTAAAQGPKALPEDLVASLEASGTLVTPPDESVPITSSDITAAIGAARAQFGPAGTAAAFPATVTVDGFHTGDEDSPLVIDDRQVILVQIVGLDMPPIGGYGMTFTPEDNNHELIVLVDAKTGEYLMASSTR